MAGISLGKRCVEFLEQCAILARDVRVRSPVPVVLEPTGLPLGQVLLWGQCIEYAEFFASIGFSIQVLPQDQQAKQFSLTG
jgi:hypothetical protein